MNLTVSSEGITIMLKDVESTIDPEKVEGMLKGTIEILQGIIIASRDDEVYWNRAMNTLVATTKVLRSYM